MEYSFQDAGSHRLVTITGGIGLGDMDELQTLLLRILSENQQRVVVDCGEAGPVHSRCLNLLIHGCRTAQSGGRSVTFFGPRPGHGHFPNQGAGRSTLPDREAPQSTTLPRLQHGADPSRTGR